MSIQCFAAPGTVFVLLNSHKKSLFLFDLVHCTDVRFLFQYGVGLGLRGCYSNVRLGRSRSARLITKNIYTAVSEWASETFAYGSPRRNHYLGVAWCSIYLVQDCSLRFVCISPPLPPVINKEVDYRVGCTPATKLRTWEAGWNPNLTTGLYLSGCGMRHTHWLISYFQLWHAPHLLAHQSLAGCVATTPIIMHLFTGCVAGYP